MNMFLVLTFLMLNIGFGLTQIWITLAIWYFQKNQLLPIETLIRDGSLLLFSAALVARSTYSLVQKPSAIRSNYPVYVFIASSMTLGVVIANVLYAGQLSAAIENHTQPEFLGSYSYLQVYMTIASVIYSLLCTGLTGGLKKEEPSVFS